jgi:hypothetical protein
MGPDLRAQRLRLLVVLVLAATGLGLPARAHTPADHSPGRVATVPVRADGSARTAAVRLPFPATHIGLRWEGEEDAPVEIRWQGTGGWGPWAAVPVWEDAGDHDAGVVASGLLRPAANARRLALRWPAGVAAVKVIVIDAGHQPMPAEPLPKRRAVNPSGAPQPEVISRQAWGADESMRKGPVEFAPISKLVVHHTVTPNNDPDPAQTVRAVYAYHTRHNKWNDIGYNFLVDQQGRVYEGRFARSYRPGEVPTGEDEAGRGVVGAHVKGLNPGSVGVAVLGDYSGGYAPPGPALDAVVRLLAWEAGRHGIDPHGAAPFTATDGSRRTFPNISGHRDVGQTGCPGGRLYERLPEIRHRVAGGAPPSAPEPLPAPPAPPPAPVPEFPGFWSVGADGRIQPYGDARPSGDLAGQQLGGPIVSMAAAPTGQGYWMVGADGGVFAFGDAAFLGAPAGQLRSPAVHLEPTPTGQGYWVLTAAGEVFAFGDANLRGQLFPLPATAVGLAGTPSGQGYWVATADAQVFAFGDAVLHAATGAGLPAAGAGAGPPKAAAPTVAIAASPDGKGYWLLGRDGGVFSFGVPFHGSVAERQPYDGAVSLEATPSGAGYYVAGADGSVFAFGDGDRRREHGPGGPGVVDVAFRPTGARPAVSPVPDPPPPPAAAMI